MDTLVTTIQDILDKLVSFVMFYYESTGNAEHIAALMMSIVFFVYFNFFIQKEIVNSDNVEELLDNTKYVNRTHFIVALIAGVLGGFMTLVFIVEMLH